MKKAKQLCVLFLTIILLGALTAIPVGAQSLGSGSFILDYATAYKYMLTHPKEAIKIIDAMVVEREQTNEITLDDSPEAQTYMRLLNIPLTIGVAEKTALVTVNPSNTERNRIISIKVSNPVNFPTTEKTDKNSQICVLSAPTFNYNAISIDPKIVYVNRNHEMVVAGTLMNYSDRDIDLRGIPDIQLNENGKIVANGNTANFEEPMKMSHSRKKQVNTGVHDGLPSMCFIIIVFEPGTYDDTVDISSLNNLECNYSLDYSYLN